MLKPFAAALVATLFFVVLGTIAVSAPGDYLWSQGFGGQGNQVGVAVEADGSDVLLVGDSRGELDWDFGGGPLEYAMAMAKFDGAGNHVWSKSFGVGGFGHDTAVDDSHDIYFVGSFDGDVDLGGGPLLSGGGAGGPYEDIFLAKFDADGNHIWSMRFGDANDQQGRSVAATSDGGAIITGEFSGTVNFGGGVLTSTTIYDAFVARLDANGDYVWSVRSTGPPDQGFAQGVSVAVDSADNVFVAGLFQGTIFFGATELVSNRGAFLLKLDSTGNLLWSKQFPSTVGVSNSIGSLTIPEVAIDDEGNVALTSGFESPFDFGGGSVENGFLVKFDSSGNHLWSKGFGNVNWGQAGAVAVDSSGQVLATGNFNGTINLGGGSLASTGNSSAYLVVYDSDGSHEWSRSFGEAVSTAIDADDLGGVVISGLLSAADFGGGQLVASYPVDIFLAKFAACVGSDADCDGLPDSYELAHGCLSGTTWDALSDPDSDGLSSAGEFELGTDPCDPDSDGDGYQDNPATAHANTNSNGNYDNCGVIPNPTQSNGDGNARPNGPMLSGDDVTWPSSDAFGDACDGDRDNDGLSDVAEATYPVAGCTSASTPLDPLDADTDGDHLADGWECFFGSDPASSASRFLGAEGGDEDGDHVPDLWEKRGYNASGLSTDSDGDGCHDLVEIASIDANKAIGDSDRLAVARRALGIWAPEPAQDYVLDIDKNGTVGDPDRLFVARAALLPDWLAKSCL